MNYGGLLFCYDLTDGKLLWTYGNGGAGNSTSSGLQTHGYYPGFIQAIGDGVVFIGATQHTITTPIPKGNYMRAVNATTGEELWTISDYTGGFMTISFAMADGYCTFFNGYDNQIYSVGKGPTALTVTAPDLSAASGQPVVIRGTVYDVSSGTKQDELAARFANGVPVSSDASMPEWMGYLYQDKPLPTNFTGVEVTLNVVDSNGNYRTIGSNNNRRNRRIQLRMATRYFRRIHSRRNIRRHTRILAINSNNCIQRLNQQQQPQHQPSTPSSMSDTTSSQQSSA